MVEPYGKILRLPQLREKLGISRSQVYVLMKRGKFPKSIALCPRSVGWLESDVDAWIADRILGHEFESTRLITVGNTFREVEFPASSPEVHRKPRIPRREERQK